MSAVAIDTSVVVVVVVVAAAAVFSVASGPTNISYTPRKMRGSTSSPLATAASNSHQRGTVSVPAFSLPAVLLVGLAGALLLLLALSVWKQTSATSSV